MLRPFTARALCSLLFPIFAAAIVACSDRQSSREAPPSPVPTDTVTGGVDIGAPLAGAQLALAVVSDDGTPSWILRAPEAHTSGALRWTTHNAEFRSTGRFALEIPRARPAGGDFRLVVNGQFGGTRPESVELRADVRDFDLKLDQLHVNAVTTLIAAYRDAHPELTLDQATAVVEAFLDIPSYVDAGDINAGSWLFDHGRFLASAAAHGGVNRFIAQLVEEIEAGGAGRSFRASAPPGLTPPGIYLTCVNTVAWNHGATPSSPPYVQVGSEQYFRANTTDIQVVTLQRQTLELVSNESYSTDDSGISQVASYLDGLDAGHLVIVAGPASSAAQMSPGLARIGASQLMDQSGSPATAPGNWSVIGVPGLAYGQAAQSSHVIDGVVPSLANCQGTSDGDAGANLSGYFTLDSTAQNYAFTFAEYIPFDTRVPNQPALSNAMKLGDQTYTVSVQVPEEPTAAGGFQATYVDRRTGKVLQTSVYPTVKHNPAQGTLVGNAPTVSEFEDVLQSGLFFPDTSSPSFGDGPNQLLYFIASVGQPAVAETALFSSEMRDNLNALGASPHTFMSLTANDNWSMAGYDVGDPALPRAYAFESSSRITPDTPNGRLVGFLARNPRNDFAPVVADFTGELVYDLYPLALQPASPWPFDDTAGYQSANAYIAANLRLPQASDVRLNYPNTNLDFSGDLYTDLSLLSYPGAACNCSEDEWNDLQAGLLQEFEWVGGVRTLLTNLKAPLDQSQSSVAVDLAAVANQVESSLGSPGGSSETIFFTILSTMASAASAASGISGLGLPVAAFKFAYDITKSSDGSPLDPVRAEAEQLGAAVANAVATTLATYNQLQDVIVSDYGRLSDVGGNALTNPAWAWDGGTTNLAATLIEQSATQRFYAALMPTAYRAYRLIPTSPNNDTVTSANNYVCEGHDPETGGSKNVETFKQAAASGQFDFVYDYANSAAQKYVWVWYSSVNNQGQATVPPSSLTDPLFQSIEDAGGVGLYAPAFWYQSWTPADLECPPDRFD